MYERDEAGRIPNSLYPVNTTVTTHKANGTCPAGHNGIGSEGTQPSHSSDPAATPACAAATSSSAAVEGGNGRCSASPAPACSKRWMYHHAIESHQRHQPSYDSIGRPYAPASTVGGGGDEDEDDHTMPRTARHNPAPTPASRRAKGRGHGRWYGLLLFTWDARRFGGCHGRCGACCCSGSGGGAGRLLVLVERSSRMSSSSSSSAWPGRGGAGECAEAAISRSARARLGGGVGIARSSPVLGWDWLVVETVGISETRTSQGHDIYTC